MARCCEIEAPTPGKGDAVFFHDVGTDDEQMTSIAVINSRLQLGVMLRYSKLEFPLLSQAKIMKPQDYFLALEPGNCTPEGRARMREMGQLKLLQPQEQARFSVTVEVIDGREEIEALERTIEAMR
jgi:hypothetical protein